MADHNNLEDTDMGFSLKLSEDRSSTLSPYYAEVERMVREVNRLSTVWCGHLDRADIEDLCKRVALSYGMDANAGNQSSWAQRQYTVPPKGALAKGDNFFYFVPGKPIEPKPPHAKGWWDTYHCAVVEVVEAPHLIGKSKTMVCPSCKQTVLITDTSLAHNVISQRYWKQIIDEVFDEFLSVVEAGTMAQKVKSFSSLSGIESGEKMAKEVRDAMKFIKLSEQEVEKQKAKDVARKTSTNQQTIDKAGDDAVKKMKPSTTPSAPYMPLSPSALNQQFVERFLADSMLECSRYAASDFGGRQCRNCEEVQGNATLLQRFALERDGVLPDIKTVSGAKLTSDGAFVGEHMKAIAHAKVSGSVPLFKKPEDALAQVTLAQISRYLYGVEKTIGNIWDETYRAAAKVQSSEQPLLFKEHFSPLLLTVVDHMDEFVWTFRSVALRIANQPYTGNFGALKIEGGQKVA